MAHTVTLIPGDGIGPEITEAVLRIVHAAGVAIEWDRHEAGLAAFKRHGTSLPKELLDSVIRNRVGLKGPVATPIAEGFQSVNVGLRKALNLYANLRPVYNLPGVKSRYEGVDLIIIRENTEDLYSGLEHEVVPGVVESLKIITSRASERIAEFAFRYAREHNRRHVTAVHKANIMKLGDGLFLGTVRAVALRYPDVKYEERIVDAACMHLVMHPEKFNVLVLPNLYGDIVSDLCAGLVGGLGVVPGANHGDEYAVFEAVHGTAPDIAGQGIANPTAMLLSSLMMLRHLGEDRAANAIWSALTRVLTKSEATTKDLGGGASTWEFTDAIIGELDAAAKTGESVVL
jgi:isocitrate dehydrogenase (NAD+)